MAYERSLPDDRVEDKNVFEIAFTYLSAGLSLIPIKPDGSKAPYSTLLPWDDLLQKHVWKPYQAQLPSHDELINWFTPTTGAGIGIIGGSISGNLEIIDFDQIDLYDLWHDLVRDIAPDLLPKLTLQIDTPKPGRHVYYRCQVIEGNQKLAETRDGKTLIETRGDGGYVVAPGSPLACHPSGRPYEVFKGSFEDIPTITTDERKILLNIARSFNERPKKTVYQSQGTTSANGERPGDQYNARVSWPELMQSIGATATGSRGEATYWKRPGKTEPGHSAITGNGDDRLYVFSSNFTPFELDTAYDRFGAYTTWFHAGDFSAAAKELFRQGYGRNGQPHAAADDERNTSANGDQPPPDDPPDEEIPIHLTDRGNALRLIQAHGKDLHYIYRWKKWLVWDGTRWIVDEGNLVEARAKHVIVGLYAAAQATITRVSKELQKGDLGEEEQNKRAKEIDSATAILKWALKSESADRLAGMLRHARSERGIPITPEQLDANPWILNCCNGTIDLKTGKLYKHHRDDLCTKRLEVDYHPRARYRHPITFLYRIMGKPKADAKGLKQELRERRQRARRLVKFLQRAVGYSLTGVTQEAVLFFMYGTGDNGKSTFSETLSALLGPYFQKAPQELLMRKDRHNTGGPSPEIARLCGARLVMASEVSEHHRLNESQVKDLTGDDTLTARGLYEAFFDFRPTHKLWMYGNHKPTITGTDHAIWKRPKLIPFTETIPKSEQIKGYREKYLMPELPGILAWAVRGCLSWQKGGLQVPEEVEAATEEYRHEMDVLAYFLDEHCVYGNPSYTARGTELHEAYLKAIDHDKEAHLGQRKFYQRLRERGFTSYIGHGNATYWRGVGFRINPNADPDNQAAHG